MHRMMIAGALAGALLGGTAAKAEATLITYTGTVERSEDTTGVFGGSGSSLDGLPFKLVYELSYPVSGAYFAEAPTYATYIGGQTFGAPSIQSATLTINGIARHFDGTYQSSVTYYDQVAGYYDQIFHEAQDYVPGIPYASNHFVQAGIASDIHNIVGSADFLAPLSYTFKRGDTALGSFFWSDVDQESGAQTSFASGNFSYTGVAIASASAVPEPATWALMIVGFGAIGIRLRMRRRGAQAPHAS
jgi:hypothetical protein